VDVIEFSAALERLNAGDLHRVARSLDTEALADEVDWWRATIAIDRAIRHGRCGRQAGRAATQAAALVEAAARREGFRLPDAEVTRVARAAAEIARGIVAGPGAQPIVRILLEHWSAVFAAV
jgi:hypothetical protein